MKNLINKYKEIFLESPKYYIDTGGRFEIIGNHTDHNHGLCIVANCSLRIKAVLDKDDEIVDIKSKGYDRFSFSLSSLSKRKRPLQRAHHAIFITFGGKRHDSVYNCSEGKRTISGI